MELKMIAAVTSPSLAIGDGSTIPWYIPTDLKRFKQKTLNHIVIMGRRTYDSIGKPLSDRTNYVLSRDEDFHPEGVEVFTELEDAINAARTRVDAGYVEGCYIIGGGEIYRQALAQTNYVELTVVDMPEMMGPVTFPVLPPGEFTCVENGEWQEEGGIAFQFQAWKRIAEHRFGEVEEEVVSQEDHEVITPEEMRFEVVSGPEDAESTVAVSDNFDNLDRHHWLFNLHSINDGQAPLAMGRNNPMRERVEKALEVAVKSTLVIETIAGSSPLKDPDAFIQKLTDQLLGRS